MLHPFLEQSQHPIYQDKKKLLAGGYSCEINFNLVQDAHVIISAYC